MDASSVAFKNGFTCAMDTTVSFPPGTWWLLVSVEEGPDAGEVGSLGPLDDCPDGPEDGILESASRRFRAMRSSRHRKKRSKTQFSKSQDFCSSFNPRRHSFARCSASFRAVLATRAKWIVWMHKAENVCVILLIQYRVYRWLVL